MGKRNATLLVAGLVLFLLIAGGVRRRRNQNEVPLELGFDAEDLEGLEDKLEGLSFDDLEGFESDELVSEQVEGLSLNFTLGDLEGLEDIIKGLDFDDLEGFSET